MKAREDELLEAGPRGGAVKTAGVRKSGTFALGGRGTPIAGEIPLVEVDGVPE